MIKASVFIITKNEEKHIKRVLESVKDFDEIVIVDSGSTDNTLNIAKNYTTNITHQDFLGYSQQKEFAKNLCKNEWVLNLDADEELSSELKNEIIKTIANDDTDALEVNISSQYLGRFPHRLCKFITRIRFFKRSLGFYPKKLVHESIKFTGQVKKSNNFIYDYGSNELNTHIDKINAYSTLRAIEKFQKHKSFSIIKLVFIFPLAFCKSYIIKRNFLNGVSGFISATNLAFYAFLKEAKLYEAYLKDKL
ncbi:glycosyltransferase family 2 protein [Campylobacter sp. faydin G-24]|uniref:Glycosyltransferase family 2 protein n=1 Tax=Campylobacter anatolicus TaxID=2829105 RepID=A0ABS5HGL1_9BACT|nr:glycosyltransferase family 2 protein [Campylobacter anatolicus]MBR8461685.1 glycosyltransferase family 2 protein [Campylobacter anatolicus]MBR8463421.1 glycosyltransferase family 2 protein [Campylobacter anatolicus]MBR8465226.1 glycosyltransferase family 2 protein [Campylobacter anatolicus]